jgi:hypothetical protein
MTRDFVSCRQIAHLKMSEYELDRRLGAIAEAFDPAWLEGAGHPLQNLWQRKDGFATNRLCLLGDAIAGLKPIDAPWVKRHVEKIKGRQANERRGSMFEMLGTNLFRHAPQIITPTKRNAAGYDAILTLPDGAKVDLSLKSYGTSTHERLFRTQAASSEQAFKDLMKARRPQGAVLQAIANAYPSRSDWQGLRDQLPTLLHGQATQLGIWAAKIGELPPDFAPYSDEHLSHLVFITAPFHVNERKNLSDKFDEAFANAKKHEASKPDSVRVVLMRVPETISLLACGQWAKDYLASHHGGPIDGVYLYQLTVVDQPSGQSMISHAFSITETPGMMAWRSPAGKSRRTIAMNLAVGVGTKPTQRQIIGGPVTLQLDDGYLYQRGDFYTLHKVDLSKPTNVIVRNPASGVFQHAVLQHPDGHCTLSGHFPPVKEITLFD